MHLEMAVLTTHHHPISPQGAGSIIGIGETRGLNHLSSLHLPQTMVSRVIAVHYQQHPQCHPDLTSQMDQGIQMRQMTPRGNTHEDKPPHL